MSDMLPVVLKEVLGQPETVPANRPLTSTELIARRKTIVDVMKNVMIEGVHYGQIPGVENKMLLKPGADLICNTFKLSPDPSISRTDLGNGHREYEIRIALTHAETGTYWGTGLGSCSTLESKYRYRQGSRVCPHCGKEAIIKGREEYGGGWVCLSRKGGCNAKFADHDAQITSQSIGRVENPDIADVYNTVLKIAKKRALADAVITATGCADMFSAVEEEEVIEEHEEELPEKVRPQQIGLLMAACKSFGVTEERLKQYLSEHYKLESRKEIPLSLYNDILAWVKKQGGAK